MQLLSSLHTLTTVWTLSEKVYWNDKINQDIKQIFSGLLMKIYATKIRIKEAEHYRWVCGVKGWIRKTS